MGRQALEIRNHSTELTPRLFSRDRHMKTGQEISDERAVIVAMRRRANMMEADADQLRREAKERERLLEQSLLELPARR